MIAIPTTAIRPHPVDDAALLHVGTASADDAFRIVFDRHVDAIRRYLLARVGPDAADDLVAETFAIAWETRARFHSDAGSARPWLYGIATTLLKRQRAQEQHWQELLRRESVHVAEAAPGELGDGLVRSELKAALARLSLAEREILLLVALGDLSIAGAARVVGISSVAARMRLHRARRRVAQELTASNEDGGS